ncbi:MAG: hypothetical protein ABL973_03680 [Micropepsaceae bacterium]
MKQLISRPIQKWGATMVMTIGAAVVLVIAAIALTTLLPPGSYGTVLVLIAVFAIVLGILMGRVIRWLAED